MLEQVRKLMADPNLAIVEQIQPLWSNFGQLVRCYSPKLGKTIIVKYIEPPALERTLHPRGWNTQVSHNRKLRSYQIEAHFYRHYAINTDHFCPVPQLLQEQSNQQQTLLVLEDLHQLGYTERRDQGNEFLVRQGINWLAHFHAKFINTSAAGLWPQGGYWHLATRQDEWQAMPDNSLKTNALAVDQMLQNAQFTTLLHGDAKLQNMCFEPESGKVAAVDFQYVGLGPGIIDLVYFMASSLNNEQLNACHGQLLDYYFCVLQQALILSRSDINFTQLKAEYTRLYPFAWADLHRFLLGWDATSWKISDFMTKLSDSALLLLKQ